MPCPALLTTPRGLDYRPVRLAKQRVRRQSFFFLFFFFVQRDNQLSLSLSLECNVKDAIHYPQSDRPRRGMAHTPDSRLLFRRHNSSDVVLLASFTWFDSSSIRTFAIEHFIIRDCSLEPDGTWRKVAGLSLSTLLRSRYVYVY